jgi:asparagine synthase (glutamine-hydrolysing)
MEQSIALSRSLKPKLFDQELSPLGKDNEIEEICSDIRRLLDQAVHRSLTSNKIGILLSGGLDTSIIATISRSYARPSTYTVALEGAPAPDVEYSSLIARELGFDHKVHYLDEAEVNELITPVVKVLGTFDPMEVRNSLTIFAGMRVAKEDGIEIILTGDGSDELMAGYSFFFNLKKEKLDLELQKLWGSMSFSAIPLAKSLGLVAKIPFLDPDFKSYAMSLDSKYKIGVKDGEVYGKWILRKAYEGILPQEITWRTKTPIECGSGTTTLPQLFASRISDAEFNEKKGYYMEKDKVMIRDKEHLAYYEIFRSVIGTPHHARHGKACPQCNSDVPERSTFCRICGAYPI